MRVRSITVAGLCLWAVACGKGTDTADTAAGPGTTDSATDTEEPEPVDAGYEGGQYKVSSFASYAENDDGMDIDGDGEPDNNTPNALTIVDAFVPKEDMTVEGLNGTVAGALADDTLILLMEAAYQDSELTYDILTGMTVETGAYFPSDDAFDESGEPLARLEGFFTSETEFYATADRALVGITFFPDEPAFPLPLELVTVEGSVDGAVIEGDLYGVIPTDDLRDLLVIPLLEEAFPDPKERATYLDLVEGALKLETLADIDLGDGRRGVSCAFNYTASEISW